MCTKLWLENMNGRVRVGDAGNMNTDVTEMRSALWSGLVWVMIKNKWTVPLKMAVALQVL